MGILPKATEQIPNQSLLNLLELAKTSRLKLFVAISCVRQSFRLRARIQVRLSWSRISRLLQLCCTTKKLDLKALLNQSYKETFKWEFEKSLVGHFEHSLHHKFKTTLSKRSAEVNMRTIQASVAVRPQFLSFRPWISGLFQQYWRNGFAV